MVQASQVLRQARAAAGVTQHDLAKRAGTSRPTLSAYEHDRKTPSLETFQRLLSVLGWRMDAAPEINWSQYDAGRGRRGWVPSQLWRLPLPDAFAVTAVPLNLDWSTPSRTYDLRDRRQRARLYETVLREGSPPEISRYVDGALLIDVWADLVLPRAVRTAWEPVVTAAVTPGADLPAAS